MQKPCVYSPAVDLSYTEDSLKRGHMWSFLSRVHFGLQTLLRQEEGQDLVEYALIVALISVAAVTSMHGLANKVVAVSNGIGNDL